MSYVAETHRKLHKDIDVQTMYHMREEGMTNKQIAFALGVSPNTIYRYIGRKSEAVKHAEVQNKPPVVKPAEPEKPKLTPDEDGVLRTEDGLTMIEAAKRDSAERRRKEAEMKEAEEKAKYKPPKKSTLRTVSQRVTLEGSICKYVVDSESNSIEITDGTVTGLLDRETLMAFIDELKEIAPMIGAEIRE